LPNGLGEVGVPAAPIVNHLGTADAEPLDDLGRADELIDVESSSHRRPR
jgi:hypothetical protein